MKHAVIYKPLQTYNYAADDERNTIEESQSRTAFLCIMLSVDMIFIFSFTIHLKLD